MIDSMFKDTGSGQTMSFLDRKKQIPGDEFEIAVWKPLDTKECSKNIISSKKYSWTVSRTTIYIVRFLFLKH